MAPFFTGITRGIGGAGFGKRAGGGGVTGIVATGGNVSALAPGNGYKYHTFTGPGTFTVSFVGPGFVELLCVGGGGGGVGCGGGGGGGGALIYRTLIPVTATSYPITVGGGLNSGYGGHTGPYASGNPSSALGFTANGGGPGGSHTFSDPFVHGQPGASGGGAAFAKNGGGGGYSGGSATSSPGGTNNSVSPPVGWGNPGQPGPGYGGGAGAPGSSGGGGLTYSDFAGPLIGVPTIPSTFAVGGPNGGPGSYIDPHPAPNTGSGGNAGPYCAGGGAGASGLVVIRYLLS
jgi:hypothetical protein